MVYLFLNVCSSVSSLLLKITGFVGVLDGISTYTMYGAEYSSVSDVLMGLLLFTSSIVYLYLSVYLPLDVGRLLFSCVFVFIPLLYAVFPRYISGGPHTKYSSFVIFGQLNRLQLLFNASRLPMLVQLTTRRQVDRTWFTENHFAIFPFR